MLLWEFKPENIPRRTYWTE